MRRPMLRLWLAGSLLAAGLLACGNPAPTDAGSEGGRDAMSEGGRDATPESATPDSSREAGPDVATDVGPGDATPDASAPDARPDATTPDATAPDASVDAAVPDATPEAGADARPDAPAEDARPDATTPDVTTPDVTVPDVTVPDAGPGGCRSNADCDATSFCLKPRGMCSGTGVCEPRPDICVGFTMVCGCDGMTYFNECQAYSAGVSVERLGECP